MKYRVTIHVQLEVERPPIKPGDDVQEIRRVIGDSVYNELRPILPAKFKAQLEYAKDVVRMED